MARRRAIAAAVVGRAQERPSLEYLAADLDLGLTGVEALPFAAATGISGDAAGLRCLRAVVPGVPVGRPLPDVADHVIEAVAVGREDANRRRAPVAVRAQVLVGKRPLPGVGQVPVAG